MPGLTTPSTEALTFSNFEATGSQEEIFSEHLDVVKKLSDGSFGA